MEASKEGHLDIVEYLLEKDADVNIQNNEGKTVLDYIKILKNNCVK